LAERAQTVARPLILLTNGDGLEDPAWAAALGCFQQVWIKWDPGAAGGAWRRLAAGGVEARILRLAQLAPDLPGGLSIQSLLFRTAAGGGNADAASRARWLGAMTRLRPRAIHLGTCDRSTERPGILPVERVVLEQWGAEARAGGLAVHVVCAGDA
jgi:hypothetical protein